MNMVKEDHLIFSNCKVWLTLIKVTIKIKSVVPFKIIRQSLIPPFWIPKQVRMVNMIIRFLIKIIPIAENYQPVLHKDTVF